jgi:hypothetical protein
MSEVRSILVRGDGIAAACCAQLLRKTGIAAALDDLQAGHRWRTERLARAGDPALQLRGFRLQSQEIAA